MAQRWGDVLDDDSDEEDMIQHQPSHSASAGGLVIPPTHKSRIDSKGIQIVTSYRQHPANASQLMKTITKVKVATEKVREAKAVEERRKWKKFGNALKEGAQRSTILSKDDIMIEDPNADNDLQEDDAAKDLSSNLNEFWAKQQKRQLERKYGVDGAKEEIGAGGGWNVVGPGGGATSGGKYVPPSARAAMASGVKLPERRTDDLNTIRVTNISENTTEADLQDLFKPFGRISRVYLAKDKETLQSRGFAFVSFVNKDDAAKAMEKLQGFGYDHLILKLEWARPNTPKEPGAEGTQFRSGYGKALAQDTKERVSYASNLTKGTGR